MIEVEHLHKSYGPFQAVRDVSFSVEKGEIVGFLGPNGAGKTTTMRILAGFLPPTDGTARIAGFDVFEKSMEARRVLGYLPELPPLYPDLTVRRYLRFVAELKDVPHKEIPSAVGLALEKASLTDVPDRLIRNLSKGYRQRVGLAQALVHNPPVLILDEPTVGLDPGQIVETRKLISSLAGDHTVILSTHILPEVAATCQRVIIIYRGTITAEDTIDKLQGRVSQRASVRVVVKGPRQEVEVALSEIDGVTQVTPSGTHQNETAFSVEVASETDIREAVFKTVVAGDWTLLELAPQRASLEDVFMKLTTHDEGVPDAQEAT
jgi:ABC-2 type transport system ATP-binding protein